MKVRYNMCQFISWIEKNNQAVFLTADDVFRTKAGRELQEYCNSADDLVGHGAIKHYYGNFEGGIEKECTDFSTPNNFPPEIVEALKAGKFRGLSTPIDCLLKPARDEYERVIQVAWDKYKEVEQAAWAKHEKVERPAWAKYKKVIQAARDEYKKVKRSAWAKYKKQAAWDEYEKVIQAARDEYKKVIQAAWDEYKKVERPSWDEYEKVKRPAWDEYEKVIQAVFWDLFGNPKNRKKCWR